MRRIGSLLCVALLAAPTPGRADPVECIDSESPYCVIDETGPLLDGTNECVSTTRFNNPNRVDHACVAFDHEPGHYPDSTTCLTDGAVAAVAWWYDGSTVACVGSGEWWTYAPAPYSAFPSVCVWTGAGSRGRPLACMGRDELDDTDFDGEYDDPMHCLVWLAGSGFCFTE